MLGNVLADEEEIWCNKDVVLWNMLSNDEMEMEMETKRALTLSMRKVGLENPTLLGLEGNREGEKQQVT